MGPEPFHTEHHKFGRGEPVYLIAEIGLNHNGDLSLAMKQAEAAKSAGAHGAKFQLFRSELFIHESPVLDDGTSVRDFFRGFELKNEEWKALADHTRNLGLDFLCSVFDFESLAFYADELKGRAVKIASGDITNHALIRRAEKTGLPVILSTGTADEAEVEAALRCTDPDRLVLMQCVSSYPADPSDYNLSVLTFWKDKYSVLTGLSDHTAGNQLSIASAALGACMIERHFTMDRSLPGPDQKMSLGPDEFRRMAEDTAVVYSGLGDGVKTCTKNEAAVRTGARRGLYAAKDIPAGSEVTENDFLALRPLNGYEGTDGILSEGRSAVVGSGLKKGEGLKISRS